MSDEPRGTGRRRATVGDDLGGLLSRVLDLEARVRKIEGREDPYGRRLVEEFHDLQTQVRQIDREGTATTKVRLDHVQAETARLWIEIEKWEKEREDMRRSNRSVLITSAAAIAVSLISSAIAWAISQAVRGGP